MSKLVWNRAASSYEDVLDGQYTQAIGPILDAARVESGVEVLDVGTGPGSIAAAASTRGARATRRAPPGDGVDASPHSTQW